MHSGASAHSAPHDLRRAKNRECRFRFTLSFIPTPQALSQLLQTILPFLAALSAVAARSDFFTNIVEIRTPCAEELGAVGTTHSQATRTRTTAGAVS